MGDLCTCDLMLFLDIKFRLQLELFSFCPVNEKTTSRKFLWTVNPTSSLAKGLFLALRGTDGG